MATLHKRVISVLQKHYPDLLDGLEEVPETNRVLGIIASGVFTEMDDRERQEHLWTILKQAMTPDELRHVGPIATLTPAEAEIDVSVDG